jgi:peptidoglycan-associated lipoprotein
MHPFLLPVLLVMPLTPAPNNADPAFEPRGERAQIAACHSDSECGGGVCRRNKCTTAGGTCYADSECPGGSCRRNKCTTSR